MANVSVKTPLPVAAEKVWDLIGNFNALPDWHPAVERSEISEDKKTKTTIRTLHLVGGGVIVEKLEQINPNERAYRYSIVDSPLPVSNYTATLTVHETPTGCEVEWASDFDAMGAAADEAAKVIQGIYDAGFDNLKKMFSM